MKYEIQRSWNVSAGFAWAILWRSMVVAIPIGLAIKLIPLPQSELLIALRSFIEIIVGFFVMAIASYWLLGRGYSNKKIILMEHAGYQKIEKE